MAEPVVQVAAEPVDLAAPSRRAPPGSSAWATVRSSAISVVGVARTTCRSAAYSSRAARPRAPRTGTTRRARTAPRTPACRAARASRPWPPARRRAGGTDGRAGRGARPARRRRRHSVTSRNASSGDLGVDDHLLAAGEVDDEVGPQRRRRRGPAVTCSSKSQRSTSPASSTARRRCSSPHRPRTCGSRSAVARVGGLPAQQVGGVPHVVDLLLQLALPGDPLVVQRPASGPAAGRGCRARPRPRPRGSRSARRRAARRRPEAVASARVRAHSTPSDGAEEQPDEQHGEQRERRT